MTIDIQKSKGKVSFVMQRLSKAALFVVVEKKRASAVYAGKEINLVSSRERYYTTCELDSFKSRQARWAWS